MKLRPIKVWTWAMRGASHCANRYYLCYTYAFPTKRMLLDGGKPAPEAVPVQVVMQPVEGKGIACEKARKARRG